MFKGGDKVKRSTAHITNWWKETCADMQVDPDRVFTVSHIQYDSILLQETGNVSFELRNFKLAQQVTQIQVGDVYQTLEGRDVRIICVDYKNSSQNIIGLIDCGDTELFAVYDSNGKDTWDSPDCLVLPWNEHDTDWTKVAVDTLIEVDYSHTKVRRYFSHTESNLIYYFRDGTTSKTFSGISSASKKYCKIYKEEK